MHEFLVVGAFLLVVVVPGVVMQVREWGEERQGTERFAEEKLAEFQREERLTQR